MWTALIYLAIYFFVGGVVFAIMDSTEKYKNSSMYFGVLWPVLLVILPFMAISLCGQEIGKWIVKTFKNIKKWKRLSY